MTTQALDGASMQASDPPHHDDQGNDLRAEGEGW